MRKDFPFRNFIATLYDRIPQRGKLAETLAELLQIEKEAVYRRLRGSVPFSFQEVHAIAVNLGFSLDSIAEDVSPTTQQMTVLTVELLDTKEAGYKRMEAFLERILRLRVDKDSESGAIGSIIPPSLIVSYEYINKFHLFKWSHQFGNPQNIKTYAETCATESLRLTYKELISWVQDAPKMVYIFDRRFIEYFIGDVLFFYDIRLITREDVLRIKNDLHLLINDLERYTVNGRFDTGNRIDLFLANVQIDANYIYTDAAAYKFIMMRSFAFSDSYSFDKNIFQNLSNWLNFLKRTSTLISEGNVAERINFFEEQRRLVEGM